MWPGEVFMKELEAQDDGAGAPLDKGTGWLSPGVLVHTHLCTHLLPAFVLWPCPPGRPTALLTAGGIPSEGMMFFKESIL